MSTTKDFHLRLDLSLRDDLYAAAQFRRQPVNQLVCDALRAYLSGETMSDNQSGLTVDPALLRMFSDDSRYDIREWTSLNTGKGETSKPIGTRIPSGLSRIVDIMLAHPACPLTTRSDFVADAVMTTLYVAARARLGDEEIVEFARQERKLARTITAQERFRSIQTLLRDLQIDLDNMDRRANPEVAGHVYKQVGTLLADNVPKELSPLAISIAREAWGILPDNDVKWELGAKYPDLTVQVLA